MNTASSVWLTLCSAGILVYPSPAVLASTQHRPHRWALSSYRRPAVGALGVCAVGVLWGGWPGWSVLCVAGATAALISRLPSRRSAAARVTDQLRLAVHADLLAACLDAGMAVGPALVALSEPAARPPPEQAAVLRVGPGIAAGSRRSPRPSARTDPIGMLDEVAALLMLGADADSAWRSARAHPQLAALAAAATRSALGGSVFAVAVREQSERLRGLAARAAERSAGRAAVAMTAPLGLCFLPAFLCLGLAPVIVGLLSSLHLW